MLNILIFSGSIREGNYTQHVAQFLLTCLQKNPELHAEVVSPVSLHLQFNDEGPTASGQYPELKQKVEAADAFILVSPEYNHGYSGSLKYMLDLNLKEYIHKPVAFVGVSSGPYGGTRGIEALIHVVRELGLVATFTDVNVTNVQKEIEQGQFKDPETWARRIDRMVTELIWMASTLKAGRTASPQ